MVEFLFFISACKLQLVLTHRNSSAYIHTHTHAHTSLKLKTWLARLHIHAGIFVRTFIGVTAPVPHKLNPQTFLLRKWGQTKVSSLCLNVLTRMSGRLQAHTHVYMLNTWSSHTHSQCSSGCVVARGRRSLVSCVYLTRTGVRDLSSIVSRIPTWSVMSSQLGVTQWHHRRKTKIKRMQHGSFWKEVSSGVLF